METKRERAPVLRIEPVRPWGYLVPVSGAKELRETVLRGKGVRRWQLPDDGPIKFHQTLREGLVTPMELRGVIGPDEAILGEIVFHRPLVKPDSMVAFAIPPLGAKVSPALFEAFLPELEEDFHRLTPGQVREKWDGFLHFVSGLADRSAGTDRARKLFSLRQRKETVAQAFTERLGRSQTDQSREKAVALFGPLLQEIEAEIVEIEKTLPDPVAVFAGDIEGFAGYMRLQGGRSSFIWNLLGGLYVATERKRDGGQEIGPFSPQSRREKPVSFPLQITSRC